VADKKISALTGAATPLAGTEVLPIVQSGATVKVAVSDLTAGRPVSATSIAAGLGLVATPAYTFTGDTNTGMWSPAADTLAFSEGGVEAVRLDSSGNVGIGTSAPTAKLNVAGDTIISGNADARQIGFNFYGTSQYNFYVDGATDAAKMTIRSGTTSVATFNGSGNVGIGTSSPTSQLQLSTDSASKPTSALWTIVSDSRIKTETGEYTKGLDAVCALRPITYHYNGAAGFAVDDKENISIIAQEAIQHFPECVGTFEALLNEGDEEKTELFNWNGHALIFALVNAVKELNAVNNALTARVALLEGN
jgi:hypothetical protein